tara:strand:- start:1698 stop:2510 length:813 start_codon:yes stop_codon:yes gene_type:complete
VVEIREVKVRGIEIPQVPDWAIDIPSSIPVIPPVTQTIITGPIGFPVIDVPGCVEARETDGNNNLTTDDPLGNLMVCDGTQPSYVPMDWNPSNIESYNPPQENVQLPPANLGQPTKKKKTESKESQAKQTDIPDDIDGFTPPANPNVPVLPCPRPDDPPVGSKGKFGTGRIESYSRNINGECIAKWTTEKPQDIAFTYLPPPPVALTTGAVAAVAVTSSVLMKPVSDYILKLIRPLVKKTLKKVLPRLLKKKPKVLSVRERRLEQKSLSK